MNIKFYNHIIFLIALFSKINDSNQFNYNLFNDRRNFICNSLALSNLRNIYNNANIKNNNMNDDTNSDIHILKPRKNFKNNNIYFTGEINEETCFKLNEALINHKNMALSNQDYPNHINLYIQSPGGALLPTFALVDEIKNLGVPVHTYIRGYAASAATLLSVVGSERYMYNHSVLMIHSVKLHDQEPRTLLDVKDLNDNVDVFMDIIKNIYLENSNLNSETLNKLFSHDIWMNSTNALKYGLVDIIV